MNEALRIPKRSKMNEESLALAKILLQELLPVVESRRKVMETEEELRGMIVSLNAKFDSLAELKRENLELEREVLGQIKERLR